MVYFDYGQNRYVCSTPTVVPDIRAHVANWKRYHRAMGKWPKLSILTFAMRFLLVFAGVALAVWYGLVRSGWNSNKYYLVSLAALLPILFLWYLAERAAWNHDLRTAGLTSSSDVWGVTQFPLKR
jgi:hypothetical protein